MNELLSHFTFSYYGINWLDIVIAIVFLFYIYEGILVGFIIAFLDLLSFVISFVLGLRLYAAVGAVLVGIFSMPQGFANALGFLIISVVGEFLLSLLLKKVLYHHAKKQVKKRWEEKKQMGMVKAYLLTLNHVLGLVPGAISAFILLSFFLSIIVSLPFSPFLKHAVTESRFGSELIANTGRFEDNLNAVFGGAVNDTLNVLTVKPEGDAFVDLHFTTSDVTPDSQAELVMFRLVNQERTARGLEPLEFDKSLQTLAREHSKDMFVRGYFSHSTPEGLSPFDRMKQAGIDYGFAGENLALAPSVDLAMQGLMNSPGHKANILSKDYKKIGIGVMDGGIYGEMFSQEFTD